MKNVIFDQYVGSDTPQRHNYNALLTWTCTRSTQQCNFECHWVTFISLSWKNFNRHRASRDLAAHGQCALCIAMLCRHE